MSSDERRERRKTLNRQIFRLALGATLLVLSVLAEAQQPPKIVKVGFLGGSSAAVYSALLEQFQKGLRDLGYKNLIIEYRYVADKSDRLPALADGLVSLKVDVLVVSSTTPKNTMGIVLVAFIAASAAAADPVAVGLVDSLRRPGGNITGFTIITADLVGKRLELLKETVPKLTRVAVMWNPTSGQSWKESQLPARDLKLQLHSMQVSNPDDVESTFREAIKARSSALAVSSGLFFNSYRKQITDLATKNHLPAIYPREDFVDSGGLMSYGPEQTAPYRRAAIFVDKILKGAKPADLPVEQPTKFELVINLKTAKQIGLTIPQSVLYRADRVIK